MIAKMRKGAGFRGALDYDLKKEQGHILDTNMEGKTPRALATEFGVIRQLRPGLQKAVLHASISATPGEHLTDDQWCTIGHRYLQGMGFTDNQFVITRHTDTDHEHIHVLANRIRFDGQVVSDSQDWRRQEALMREIERDYGLEQVAPSRQAPRRAPTKGEIEESARTGTPSTKQQLQQLADAAARDCTSFTGYQQKLEAVGVELIAVVQMDSTKLSGLSYRLEGVMMKGSDLGKGYSASGIAKRGIIYDKDRDLAAVVRCHEREQARTPGAADRDSPPEQSQERGRAGRDPGAAGPGDGRLDGRDTRDAGRDRARERRPGGPVPAADRDGHQQPVAQRERSTQGLPEPARSRAADDLDSLRDGRHDQPAVSGAHQRILALAGTAPYCEPARPEGRGRGPEAGRDHGSDRCLEAIQKQIRAIGGEHFDLLLQKVRSGVQLVRTWSANELEKLTGWLQRMNARGHDIFIRPSGEHGLVLVNDLKTKDIEHLQRSSFAPAAAIEVAPDHHQAWIKLSEKAVAPRVRAIADKALTERHHGDPEHAGQNAYGYLAGFTNQSAEHQSDGRLANVLARDCPGIVAPGGPAYLAQVDKALEQVDTAQEKKRRLDAIDLFEAAHPQSDPIYEYRRQAKQLLAKHGNGIDLKRMDQMIATEMLRHGAYSQSGVENALTFASPNCASGKESARENYAAKTVQQSLSALAEQKPMQHEMRQRDHDRDRSR